MNNLPLHGFGLFYSTQVLLVSFCACYNIWQHDLRLRDVHTDHDDAYVHDRFPVPLSFNNSYVVEIIPKVNLSVVHHMILYGCPLSISGQRSEDQRNSFACSTILYAWAHGASGMRLPPGVGIPVGRDSINKGFELEIHYLPKVRHPDNSGLTLVLTDQPQPRVTGVFLMFSAAGVIQPGRRNVTLDISCRLLLDAPITLMGIRTHAHSLGRAVTGYRVPHWNGPAQLIALGNPQWPQAFYSLKNLQADYNSIDLLSGDILTATCTYDSTGKNGVTVIGSTHSDEMCNMYLLYHTDPSNRLSDQANLCGSNEFPQLVRALAKQETTRTPSASAPPFVRNSISEFLGNSNGKPTPRMGAPRLLAVDGVQFGQLSAVATVVTPSGHDLLLLHRGENRWDATSFDARFFFRDQTAFISSDPVVVVDAATMKVKYSWGSGLFVLPHGLVVQYFPGTRDPVAVFVTDVALHQVFKFIWGHWKEPVLILGTPFNPGQSDSHFCQPADVALSSEGDVFVADGYCNSRVVKFSSNGTYITQWSAGGTSEHLSHRSDFHRPPQAYTMVANRMSATDYSESPESMASEPSLGSNDIANNEFLVVHSLTVVPSEAGSLEQICAASRESAQIFCFTTAGQRIARYGGSGMLPTVYAIEYSTESRLLFAVLGSAARFEKSRSEPYGVLINLIRPLNLDELPSINMIGLDESSAIAGFYAIPGIVAPHDITLSPSQQSVYIVDYGQPQLFRLDAKIDADSKMSASGVVLTKISPLFFRDWTGAQWSGLIMLVLLVLFILLIVCIRLCWCGRRSASDVISANRKSRWSGRPTRVKRDGFRLLNQDSEGSDDQDEYDDAEDVILDRSHSNGSVSLFVDASGEMERKTTLLNLSKQGVRSSSSPSEINRSGKTSGDVRSFVA